MIYGIAGKVYRCYDNRLRCTERRPDVYENFPGVEQHLVLHVPDMLEFRDCHPFGQLFPTSYTKNYEEYTMEADLDWLWNFRGQIKIIATPYHKGKHYATHPKQFFPILNYLEEMHNNGWVHGDIRAYNMILNYEEPEHPKGWLIDFDFGGRIDENPKYPRGYVKILHDGFRLGEKGKSITFEDDWYALGQVIFQCYVMNHKNKSLLLELSGKLVSLQIKFQELQDEGFLTCGAAAELLREYLCYADVKGFELGFNDIFFESLTECNMLLEDPRTNSKGATGSPPKPTDSK